MPRYRLVHETRESGKLVLTHIFHGETADEAEHVYRAHLESDAFLRDCTEKGLYAGRVPCEVTMRWDVDRD